MISLHSPVVQDFSSEITIDREGVGPGHASYVIAEAGSNHDRDLEKAIALIDAAVDAGCNAVKFQTFRGEEIAAAFESAESRLPQKFFRWGKNLQEFYKACELPDEFHEPLISHARARGICFFSSPFSEAAVDRLAKLGVPALKIASFELVHLPLIRYAASTGLPLIISTGMAGLGDIERALDAVSAGGGTQVALLHCGSSYPLGPESAQLAAIETLRRAFGTAVGYSDHTLGIGVPIAAAALGANLLEKHFTLSRTGTGPDHAFALEPSELKMMVEQMRVAELAIGKPMKRLQQCEADHALRGRRSLFATRDLPAGTVLTTEMVKVVRPGVGLEPVALELILGCKIARDVAADSPLQWGDFFGGADGAAG